jgi:hypothetical protein
MDGEDEGEDGAETEGEEEESHLEEGDGQPKQLPRRRKLVKVARMSDHRPVVLRTFLIMLAPRTCPRRITITLPQDCGLS